MKFDEEKFVTVAKPYLATARAGDWEHALRAVQYVKELGQGRDDLNLLIAAAYIHDIGWSGVAPEGKMNLEEVLELGPRANENSARLASEVLTKLQFTDSDIETINRLIVAADKHMSEAEDEAIIVDADNLSKLVLESLLEKYDVESFPRLISRWEVELPKRIRTAKGKEIFPKLLAELKQQVLGLQK